MIQRSHDKTSRGMLLIVSVLPKCLSVLYASDNQLISTCISILHVAIKTSSNCCFNNIMTEYVYAVSHYNMLFLIREINSYLISRVKFYIYNKFIQLGVPIAHDHIVARVTITCAIRYLHGLDGTIVCNTTSCAFSTYHP